MANNVKIDIMTELFTGLGLKNKGTGAGGAKTNENGKQFEEITNNEMRLLSQGFTKTVMNKNKFGYYLSKKIEETETERIGNVTVAGDNRFDT